MLFRSPSSSSSSSSSSPPPPSSPSSPSSSLSFSSSSSSSSSSSPIVDHSVILIQLIDGIFLMAYRTQRQTLCAFEKEKCFREGRRHE